MHPRECSILRLRQRKVSVRRIGVCAAVLLLGSLVHAAEPPSPKTCQPTRSDALGPFYKPDAPLRAEVGEGYVLQGVVRSAANCQPLPNAVVEFWLAGPDGRYHDAYRARVMSEANGYYTFESHVPAPYSGRPSHIHMRVTAAHHRILVTQHYPTAGQSRATFDLVLRPQ